MGGFPGPRGPRSRVGGGRGPGGPGPLLGLPGAPSLPWGGGRRGEPVGGASGVIVC